MMTAGNVAGVADVDNESVGAIEAQLNAVDHALERLRQGTYRNCQVCGAPIDRGRAGEPAYPGQLPGAP